MTARIAVAVILARGGSKGVPGKNLRKIGGLSLIARSIVAARDASTVSAVYVSTDSSDIAKEAKRFGADVINRPVELSGDNATSESGWLHALDTIRNDFPTISDLVFLQCTSPFTTGRDIDGCLAAVRARGAASALSVVPDHSFLWSTDAAGFGRGINHDELWQRQRRQDLKPAFKENGAIYCVRAPDFERVGRRFCGPVALFEVTHPPVEIDSMADLALCDAIMRQAGAHGAVSSRASRISALKALVMDFDGVHTDDRVHVSQEGIESVTVSRSDGLGLEMLRRSGRYRLLILSKERNLVVSQRAAKLGIECLQAIDNKAETVFSWLRNEGLSWTDMLYVGNDVNDLEVLGKAGLSACPEDAHPDVRAVVDWIVPAMGGRGVLRAIAERLLKS